MNTFRLTKAGSKPWLLAAATVMAVLLGLFAGVNAASADGPGICSNNKTKSCSTSTECGAGNTCYLPTKGGQTLSNQVCMQTAANQGLQCTANDVNIAATTSLNVIKGCNFPGDTATVSFVAQFNLTAQDRYDIGVWIAEDGGNALTGKCSVSDFPISPTPPWTNLDAGSQPTDTCGDITATNNPLFSSIQNIKVACIDTNGDGNLDINTCLSWRQPGSNDLCTSPVQAFPGAPSKCRCQTLPGITILVPGVIKVDKVTDPAGDPTNFQFTLTSPVTNTRTFSLADATAPYNSGGLPLGTYAVTENVPTGWSLTSATCTSDQGRTQTPGSIVLHSGETVSCTFNDKLVPNPQLSLTKTASPTTYNAVGNVIGYSYVLKNTGNVTLSGPFTVSDNKTTVTCPSTSTLAPTASITCSASYTTTQADLDAGSVTNTAIGHAIYGGSPVNSNQAQATVNAVQAPALSLTKAATPATYDAVGNVIAYSYVLKNTGNVTLSGPFTVSDNKATVTCTGAPATLAPNASLTCSASYTITQADLDAGSVTNTATGHATYGGGSVNSNQAQATVNSVANPQLSLTKTATPTTYSAVGNVIGYSYVLKNTGNVTLSAPFTVADNKTTANCPSTPTSLAPNASITCSASYAITQGDLDAGTVTNTATGHAKFGSTTVDSNQAQATVNAIQSPALSLVKSATPPTYNAVGNIIAYSYLLKNTGNVTLSGPFTVSDNKATVTCTGAPATLAPNASLTCSASYTITQADLDAGSVTNTATASATFKGNPVPSNQAQATVNAVQAPALLLAKTATPTTYSKVGDVINYSYVLANTGNVTLSGPFTVSDNKTTVTCPSTSTLAPTMSLTCSASYTITQADLDAGSVTNIATASAMFNGKSVNSNQAQATVTVSANPKLSLVKTAMPTTYSKVGDVIGYSYVLQNIGNVTLSAPFTVSDNKTAVTCPGTPTLLAPLASITCTASYTITQADLDAGSVTNTATGHAKFGITPIDSNPDSKTVNANQTPALSLVKSANTTTYAKVGDIIGYSYVLKNIGNVTLSAPFTVADNKTTVNCTGAPATLAPNASFTCAASYTITQADLDAGLVTNIATASATFKGNSVPSNQDSKTVNAIQAPALSLVKSATPMSYSKVGDVISYSYLLENIGNVTLVAPFTVSDNKAIAACPSTPTSLAPNASITCSASYTITQADLDAGSVTNTAAGHAKFGSSTIDSNPDSKTVNAVQAPALLLAKTATPTTYSKVGDVIGYSYVLANTGNVTLSGPFTVSDNKTTVTCPSTSTLAPTMSLTCSASYTITQADLDAGSVTNIATGHAKFGTTPVDSNPDSKTVYAIPKADLVFYKTLQGNKDEDASGTVSLNDTLTFQFAAANKGNLTLTNVTITDTDLPGLSALTCIPAQPASLAPGAAMICTATYKVTQADVDAGHVKNTAVAQSDQTPPTPSTVDTPVPQNPTLSLTKSATPATYGAIGNVISYSYVVKNTGNVTLSAPFAVADNKTTVTCPSAPATLAPNASFTCSASYTITQADLDAGLVTNIATASGMFKGNPVPSNQAQATVKRSTWTGKIAPTNTTCQMYVSGTAADLTQVLYGVKSGKINNVAPGVLFYYTTVTAPDPSFSIRLLQTNNNTTIPLFDIQQNKQVVLYNADCSSSNLGTLSVSKGQATINISGATKGQVFIVSAKYSPGNVVGSTVPSPTTVHYNYFTQVGSLIVDMDKDGVDLKPK